MNQSLNEQVQNKLRKLYLKDMAGYLEEALDKAQKSQSGHIAFLADMVDRQIIMDILAFKITLNQKNGLFQIPGKDQCRIYCSYGFALVSIWACNHDGAHLPVSAVVVYPGSQNFVPFNPARIGLD